MHLDFQLSRLAMAKQGLESVRNSCQDSKVKELLEMAIYATSEAFEKLRTSKTR
jgi:hypothetical protein